MVVPASSDPHGRFAPGRPPELRRHPQRECPGDDPGAQKVGTVHLVLRRERDAADRSVSPGSHISTTSVNAKIIKSMTKSDVRIASTRKVARRSFDPSAPAAGADLHRAAPRPA